MNSAIDTLTPEALASLRQQLSAAQGRVAELAAEVTHLAHRAEAWQGECDRLRQECDARTAEHAALRDAVNAYLAIYANSGTQSDARTAREHLRALLGGDR